MTDEGILTRYDVYRGNNIRGADQISILQNETNKVSLHTAVRVVLRNTLFILNIKIINKIINSERVHTMYKYVLFCTIICIIFRTAKH